VPTQKNATTPRSGAGSSCCRGITVDKSTRRRGCGSGVKGDHHERADEGLKGLEKRESAVAKLVIRTRKRRSWEEN